MLEALWVCIWCMINCLSSERLLYLEEKMNDYLCHHGVIGMHWGVRLGPPYPLSREAEGVSQLTRSLSKIGYKEFDRLMSPKELELRKKGSCHDQVLYECSRLEKCGITPKVKFFIEADKNGQGGTTHSCVTFKLNNRFYWLENAWQDQKGLRAYTSEKKLVDDILRKWDKKREFPYVYDGNLDYKKMKPGMNLQQLIDVVEDL